MVYGKNNTIDSCYDGTENFFPIFSNESTMIFAPLKCGDIGDTAALTVQVDFLTSSGSVTKAFTTKTTIGLSQVIQPSTVVVKQLGIKTWVQPQVFPTQTVYAWYLMITNEAQTPIDSVHATLSSGNNKLAEDSGCVIVTGNNLFSVSHTTPLTSTASCQVDSQTRPGTGPFSLGQQLEVVVSVTSTGQPPARQQRLLWNPCTRLFTEAGRREVDNQEVRLSPLQPGQSAPLPPNQEWLPGS